MAIIWGSVIDKVQVEGERNHIVVGAMQGRGKSTLMLDEAIKEALKEPQEPSVEIVNSIPQEDLNFIVDLYKKEHLHTLELLGRGAYGMVYGYKNYAIKKIYDKDPHGSADAKVLKDISHLDSVVTLYAVIDDYTLILERVEGQTLRNYTETSMNNPLNLSYKAVEQFNEALMDIIKLGYTPWDMHGDNIMVNKDGSIKIVDVGLFKKHGETYDDNNEEYTYLRNHGYSQAQNLAGSELKDYIRREQMRKEQIAEAQAKSLQFMAV